MQTRPHPNDKSTMRVWLSEEDKKRLINHYSDRPARRIALWLGLHGLRSVEIMGVSKNSFRPLSGNASIYKLKVSEKDAKKTAGPGSNARECPASKPLYDFVNNYVNDGGRDYDDTLFDVKQRQVRRWLERAREEIYEETDVEAWKSLSMHDLRRTWATKTFWDLTTSGVPGAEELTMSWGGWAKTETGRGTFTSSYLGPVPDSTTSEVSDYLSYL